MTSDVATPDATTAPAPAVGEDSYVDALRRFAGDLRLMEQVVATMEQRGVELRATHLGLLLESYLGERRLADAQRCLDRLQAVGGRIEPDLRWRLALASARAGQHRAAIALLDALNEEREDPGPERSAAVLTIYVDAGRLPAARSLVRRMAARSIAARPEDIERLLEDCITRRAVKDTLALVDASLALGHAPADDLVARLVAMLARGPQPERADELVARLVAADRPVPTAATVEMLLAHARAGDLARALADADELVARGVTPSAHHRNLLLAAALTAGDHAAAWAQAAILADEGHIPTGENLERLLEVSLAAKRPDLALSALDWMLVLGVPVLPHRAGAVLLALIARGEIAQAETLLRELMGCGVTVERRAANELVRRIVRSKRLDDARAWLTRLRQGGVLRQGQHHAPLLAALVAAKRLDDALALVEEMIADRVAPTSADAARLIEDRMRAKDLAAADRVLAALADAGVALDEPVYRDLMWAHARTGDHAAASTVHARMLAAGIASDERHDKALAWASGETPRRLDEVVGAQEDAGESAASGEVVADVLTVPEAPVEVAEVAAPEPAVSDLPASER